MPIGCTCRHNVSVTQSGRTSSTLRVAPTREKKLRTTTEPCKGRKLGTIGDLSIGAEFVAGALSTDRSVPLALTRVTGPFGRLERAERRDLPVPVLAAAAGAA